MYLVQNALRNLGRNKWRNLIIALVTLTVIIAAVISLTISNAASKIIDGIRLDLGSRVEIRQDFIAMMAAGLDGRKDGRSVTLADFQTFANSKYLRHTIFNAEMYAYSDSFFAVDDPSLATTTRVNDNGEEVLVETLKMVGTSEAELLPFFGEERALVSGRMFEAPNEAIISEELALINNAALGDTIWLRGTYAQDKEFLLTIVGIYSDTTEEYLNPWIVAFGSHPAENRRNEIITSFDTILEAGWETNAGLNMKSEYYLRDPDDIAAFEAEVRSMGLPVTYDVAINQAAYDKVTGPLSGVLAAVITFMVVILSLGAIVLALLSLMAVRERKYEIGVLRAMGLPRAKVAFGLLTEAILIAFVCLGIGLSAGSTFAQPIADSLLQDRVAEVEAVPERNVALFAGGQSQFGDGTAGYIPESEIEVELGWEVFLQIIMVTLGLATLSGGVGVFSITRYEPLKILRERS